MHSSFAWNKSCFFSAWHMSHRAIKICFDDLDCFIPAPHPIDRVWNQIKEHFKIENQPDLLEHMYAKFDKAMVASLCKRLSVIASEGDELSILIFKQAGEHLARSIAAVSRKASPELTNREGGLHVLCVGSVWLSWRLLKEGFVGYLQRNAPSISELSLLHLSTTLATGAAYMAADQLHINLPRNYEHNYNVFYRYNKKGVTSNCINSSWTEAKFVSRWARQYV